MAFLCGLLQRRSFQTQAEGLLNFDRVRVFENLLLINFVLIGSGHSLTQEKRLRQIGSVFTIVLLLPFGEFFNCFSPGSYCVQAGIDRLILCKSSMKNLRDVFPNFGV